MPKKQDKISELLSRGVQDVIVRADLEKLLRSGKKLKVYLGIDPTAARLTLGNAVPLRKLRDFQNLGHEAILVVGTFTALIGDTSDKDAMRQPLTPAEIQSNFKTYKEQAAKILDFKRAKILYNGDWLSKLKFDDIVRLAQNFTVQQMIERDLYQKRLKEGKPIGLHEFLYPLMQGYDSVHMEVDVELGGNDQLFNMLAGRTLLKIYKNKDKQVLTTPLLPGLDGRKMSKSYGNTVDLTDAPNDMFGKIMSLHDELIIQYFELCTDVPLEEIREIESELKNGANPRDAKFKLAGEIVKLYHGERAARAAGEEFNRVFKQGGLPDKITTVRFDSLPPVVVNIRSTARIIMALDLVKSYSEGERLVEQGGVKKDGQKVGSDFGDLKKGTIIQVGKRKFRKIV